MMEQTQGVNGTFLVIFLMFFDKVANVLKYEYERLVFNAKDSAVKMLNKYQLY